MHHHALLQLVSVPGVLCCLLLLLPHTAAQWTTASLSQARTNFAATSVGALALFAGGADGGSFFQVVDIYNASANSWTTASLSQPRSGLAATSVGGGLALFGGGTDFGYLGVVDIYNVSANNWTTASLSQGRSGLAATSVGGLALFAGGYNSTVANSSVVDIYSVSANNWTTASLSQGRSSLAATSVGGLALFAGGSPSSGVYSSVVDIYDSSSKNWTTDSLSVGRSDLAATSIGSLAFFAGGFSSMGVSSVVDIYNVSANNWTTASLSQARHSLTATSIGRFVLFSGGVNITGGLSSVVDVYDSSSNSWTTDSLSQGRSKLVAASVGNLALFAGGAATASSDSSVVDIFTPSSAVPSVPSTQIAAEFNITVPSVSISQSSPSSGSDDGRMQVDLGLVSVEEISALDDTTVLQSVNLQTAGWTLELKNGTATGGQTSEYIFTTNLAAASAGHNNATLRYFFNTFDSDTLIVTESNYSFTVPPSLLKFSINISSWTWMSPTGKLRLTLRLEPAYVRFTRWSDTPQIGMATFLFLSSETEQQGTIARVINFGEASSAAGGPLTRVSVEASAVANTSSLTLTFGHFDDSFLFDPDFGLLVGSKAGSGGGSSDNVGLIVGVVVGVTVAVAVVSTVILGVLGVAWWRRQRRTRGQEAVSFTVEQGEESL